MRATSNLRPLPVIFIAVLVLGACEQPFGPPANIHDPAGTWVVPASWFTPADGATVSDTTPLLEWDDVSGAAGYEVQMATSAAGLDSATLVAASGSEYQVPTVLTYGTWYWRAHAINLDGVGGPWTTTLQFTVLADYGLPSPADGATTTDTTPLLDWGDAAGAAGYEVQIATTASGLGAPTLVTAITSEYQLPLSSALAFGDEVYWRIRAVNGDREPAAWSAAFHFTVQWSVSYGAVSPAAGGTTFDTTPLMDWADVAGAAGYEVRIATSAAGLDGATPVTANGSQYEVPPSSAFAYGDQVYWRVRAVNGDGKAAAWSAVLHFTVLQWTVDYGTATPADGGSTFDTTPLLDWGDVAGAAGYEVQIASSAMGLDAATPVATSSSQCQVATALSYGTWNWRVRVANDDGVTAAWGAAWSFLIAPPIAMVSVAGGTFQMGSTTGNSDEQPVHDVTVSSFLMAKYEVTQAQYQTVIGSNPSSFTGDASRAVDTVSWYDAVAFCNALSASEGLTACYTIIGTTVTSDFTKNGFRLPTEAEWEFAARGGTASFGYTYSGSNTVGDVGWYAANSGSTTHAVGTKAANELGICDMSGNVWEWCWDWYGSYGSAAETDPTGATIESTCVLRGGGLFTDANFLRCTLRSSGSPGDRFGSLGFRVVRRGG